jgi:exopolysaccharide biosynthesis protein
MLMVVALLIFIASTLIYMTPAGAKLRILLAETAITTQSFRDWSWLFVGGAQRDAMIKELFALNDKNAAEAQVISPQPIVHKKVSKLTEIKSISGKGWVGKMLYIYDPTAIRVVVPGKKGSGETVSSMVQRTGAVAGINGGGFIDPGGFGNGFAPIGIVMSGGEVMFNDTSDTEPQHVVAFTKDGTLIVGKHSAKELLQMGVTDAVSFYPRVIVNGKPLITNGDGGRGVQPRTAVGQREDGTVIFVVIDGRQAHSIGASLRDVQDLLLEEGCVNAGFLDGGSSSSLVGEGGEVLTKPSSPNGKERALPTAFLVFANAQNVKVDNIWKGLGSVDPGGTYDPSKAWNAGGSAKPSPTPATSSTPKPGTTVTPNGSASPGAKSPSPSHSPSASGGNASSSPGAIGGKVSPSPSPSATP